MAVTTGLLRVPFTLTRWIHKRTSHVAASPFQQKFLSKQRNYGLRMENIEIRRLAKQEMKDVFTLVNNEGWNCSLDYLQSCHNLRSVTWIGAVTDGKVIGSIARYDFEGRATSMAALYTVDRKYHGQGIGLKMIASLLTPVPKNAFVFAASDPAMYADYYCKPSFHTEIWTGRKSTAIQQKRPNSGVRILPMSVVPMEQVEEYDAKIHSWKRSAFFYNIILGNAACVYVAVDNVGDIRGYGALRRGFDGWKVCPVYAETYAVGEELFRTLLAEIPEGNKVIVHPCAENEMGIQLLKDSGFKIFLSFQIMYTETIFDIPVKKIFSSSGLGFSPI